MMEQCEMRHRRWRGNPRFPVSGDEVTAEVNSDVAAPQVAAPEAVQPPADLRQRTRAKTLAGRTDRRTCLLLTPKDHVQVWPHLSASPPPDTTTTYSPTAAP